MKVTSFGCGECFDQFTGAWCRVTGYGTPQPVSAFSDTPSHVSGNKVNALHMHLITLHCKATDVGPKPRNTLGRGCVTFQFRRMLVQIYLKRDPDRHKYKISQILLVIIINAGVILFAELRGGCYELLGSRYVLLHTWRVVTPHAPLLTEP